jgi:hypothetical protein
MSCLSIIQSVAGRVGIPKPSFAYSSQDTQVLQLLELLNEEGQELANRANWTALNKQATFTTLAQQSQGLLSTIAPNCSFIINDTIWNRTLRRPVFGPRTPQEWQQQVAFSINGPWSNFRLEEGSILFFPVPTAGQTCAFEYATKNWVLKASDGTTTASAWTADGDTALLDEQIMTLGLIWRWKAAKGLAYEEDFNKYERRVLTAISRDGSKNSLSLDGSKYDVFPGVVVPAGSWGT